METERACALKVRRIAVALIWGEGAESTPGKWMLAIQV
jgi:hypothetical protein